MEDRTTLPVVSSLKFEERKKEMKSAENEEIVETRAKAVAEGPSFKEALEHIRRERGLDIKLS